MRNQQAVALVADDFTYAAQVGAHDWPFSRKCLKHDQGTSFKPLRWDYKCVNRSQEVGTSLFLRVRKEMNPWVTGRGAAGDAGHGGRGASG